MKKNFILLAILILSLVTGYNVYLTHESNDVMKLALSDVEARAGIVEWWNRLDYDCSPITCYTPFGTYESSVAVKVEAGKGSQPHTWNCDDCD